MQFYRGGGSGTRRVSALGEGHLRRDGGKHGGAHGRVAGGDQGGGTADSG